MIKQFDLLSYLPAFVQEYSEIQKIMSAENPEFQVAWNEAEKIRNNIFILTANETGIRRYEKLLGIYPAADDTLETRRSRILAHWNEDVPYTIKTLMKQLEFLCGKDGFILETDYNNYILKIKLLFSNKAQLEEAESITNRIIPANMVVILEQLTCLSAQTGLYCGIKAASKKKKMRIGVKNYGGLD